MKLQVFKAQAMYMSYTKVENLLLWQVWERACCWSPSKKWKWHSKSIGWLDKSRNKFCITGYLSFLISLLFESIQTCIFTNIFELQIHIESRKRKRRQQAADATIERLVSMGFERSKGNLSINTCIYDLPYLFDGKPFCLRQDVK